MNNVLGMANVVCLPSYREGLPKVLLEAASCQRAIVATDVPGCREIVRDGENGFLVPPRDAESLAKALEVLLGDPLRRKAMGVEGRRMVESDFSDKSVALATVAVYNEAFETAR
jgi:glycosyltransferase involved in cell wall biosynthesis